MFMVPFTPLPAASQTISVGASTVSVTLDARATVAWVDNRGASDLLVQYSPTPALDDSTGFRIPAGCSQPMQVPVNAQNVLQLKRPVGSSAEVAYVTGGTGF